MKYLKIFEVYTKVNYDNRPTETFSFNNTEISKIKKLLYEYTYVDYDVSNIGNKCRLDIYYDVLTGENLVASIIKEKDKWYFINIWVDDEYYKSDTFDDALTCIKNKILYQ